MNKNTIKVSLSNCDCDKLINNIKINMSTNKHKLKLNDIKCNVTIDNEVSHDTNINYVIMKGGVNHNTGKIGVRIADQVIEVPLKKLKIINDNVFQKGGDKKSEENIEQDNPDLYKKTEQNKTSDKNLELLGYDKEILEICE
jgi:hypothetical protein